MDLKQIRVRRGNTVLSVPEIDKDSYLAKGYDVLGEGGKVVEASVPNDVPTLQARYRQLSEENAKLKKQIAELKVAARDLEKEHRKELNLEQDEEPVKPKRSRKTSNK